MFRDNQAKVDSVPCKIFEFYIFGASKCLLIGRLSRETPGQPQGAKTPNPGIPWKNLENSPPPPRPRPQTPQEDVNGEKLTVKKWWVFGADFSRFGADFFTVYANFSRFVRDING